MCNTDLLIPQVAKVTQIKVETSDVKTFQVVSTAGNKAFDHAPGQCAMLGVPGVGEAMFSIASSPTNPDFMEFSIKRCGVLTNYLHKLGVGAELTIRGPYGNSFPVDTVFKGRDLLFVAGGIGLAPVRSAVKYVFDNRASYGKIDILYGARSADDLVYRCEIEENWANQSDTNIYTTIDRPQESWRGNVGFVPDYFSKIGFRPDKMALVCGPPIMIKFMLRALLDAGFTKQQVYTTLELRMKCGIGKCGRCNIGSVFVCKDGPVFRCDQLDALPEEY